MVQKGKPMPATTDDIAKIHGRIDELVKAMYDSNLATNNNINLVIVSVAQLKAIVEAMPKPHARPCDYFSEHVKWHAREDDKADKKSITWYAAWLSFIGVVALALVKIEPLIHITK